MRTRSALLGSVLALLVLGVLPAVRAAEHAWESIGPSGHAGYKMFAAGDGRTVYLTIGTSFGLYRSADGGASWHEVDGHYFSTLAIDPRNVRHLYGCACEGADYYQLDVLESWDGGETFASAGDGLVFRGSKPDVFALVFDQLDPAVVYAASEFGLYRRQGMGAWEALGFAGMQVRSLVIDPRAPRTLVASVVDPGPEFQGPVVASTVRSRDGGLTWAVLPEGSVHPIEIAQLLFDPLRPHRLYALSNCQPFVLRAAGWQRLGPSNLPIMCTLAATPDGELFGSSFERGRLQRSTDGGVHWTMGTGPPSDFFYRLVAPPGAPGTLLVTGGRGLWRSTDDGATWSASSLGVSGLFVTALAVAPDAERTVYASPGNEGVFRSSDQGAHWQRISAGLNDDRFGNPVLVVDPRHPQTVWAGADQLHRSDDGGETWEGVSLPGHFPGRTVVDILIDPVREGYLYVQAYAPIARGQLAELTYRSTDGGHSWHSLPRFPMGAYVLALAPSDGTLYAVTLSGFFRSVDGGNTWRRIEHRNGSGAALPPYVTRLAVDPTRSNVLWGSTTEYGVWRSVDGGSSFQEVVGGTTVYYSAHLLFDPRDAQHPYAAGGGDGPYAPGGGNEVVRWSGPARGWVVVGKPNPTVQHYADGPLALDTENGWLYAATAGHGIFRIALDPR